MLYTTSLSRSANGLMLFYQDFKDTFVCNTQPADFNRGTKARCFIKISKILLYAIHNGPSPAITTRCVVLSGFQRYFWMQYTTVDGTATPSLSLFYQDVNEQFCCKSTEKIGNMQIYKKLF